jgi:sigma-B regulation protein RsbU (phosphoserine phosphatase)
MTLKEVRRQPISGERIMKIASSFLYVETGTPVYDLLSELKEPYRSAIAVVDADLRVRGVIVPRDLVEILGKPFGRDLLKRQKVEDIMRLTTSFRHDEYIQEINERISGDLETDRDAHYALVDGDGKFCGHITSQDIIQHALSDQHRELETATRIQGRLVPPSFEVRSLRTNIVCSAVMAQGVGGDYYYVKEYAPGEWFFCLCDISGKGISAAIITAVLACFMFESDLGKSLADHVVRLNHIILDTFKLEKYLTGFFARFSEMTGELEYCDMGHSFFFVFDGVSVQQLSNAADNVPIGLVPTIDPVVRTLRIAPGTVLILVTDGIIEQKNRAGKDFPLTEIGKILASAIAGGEGLVRAKIRILESFFTFKKDTPQHDDVSMLLFHYIDA